MSNIVILYVYMGASWVFGCIVLGSVITNHSRECQISRQKLCQASLAIAGLAILSFTSVRGYNGYVTFALVYGFFYGGHSYALKMYIYYKVRARNFARTWSFAQFVMGLPTLVGIPATGLFLAFGDLRYILVVQMETNINTKGSFFLDRLHFRILWWFTGNVSECGGRSSWQPGNVTD